MKRSGLFSRVPPPRPLELRVSRSTSRLNTKALNGHLGGYRSSDSLHHSPRWQPIPTNSFLESSGPDVLRSSGNSNSTMTSASSVEHASGTERNSIVTKASSFTDLSPGVSIGPFDDESYGGMTVEDAVSMYLDGFADIPESQSTKIVRTKTPEASTAQPSRPPAALDGSVPGQAKQPPTRKPGGKTVIIPGIVPPCFLDGKSSRDRYGFRKASQHVSIEEYEAWSQSYSGYLAQQKHKWDELLQENGLPMHNPATFPSKCSRMKRFVRRGIPPEYRGAAWFYYAGGYDLMKVNPGYFEKLVKKAMCSSKNDDKEHIERDLHRTFPDNLHFKPDIPASIAADGDGGERESVVVETQMIQSLRRVLYAFALHNPKVGYTQSLNFVAGLLLLFLPEENAFWMLHIVTSEYLPGTHEVSLEGANVDLWILMVLLRNSSPNVYAKIASSTPRALRGKPAAPTVNSQLPDITLGLTNWLMSLFIGSLPLETTLRVWDVLFYEGSKTFFRVALAIFKACEKQILTVSDPMEVFQVIQTGPKKLLDANSVMEECFARKLRVGQSRVEDLRASRRAAMREKQERPVSHDEERRVPFQERIRERRTARSKSHGRRHDRNVGASLRQFKNHAFG